MGVFVGIDVAKATLAVALRPGGACFEVSNDAAGRRALTRRLKGVSVERILLEATGGYEQPAVDALVDTWPLIRIAPHRARAFAQAMGTLAKTDPIDAAMLAHLAQVIEGPLVRPVSPQQRELQGLVQRRDPLVHMRDDECRRLHQTTCKAALTSLTREIKHPRLEIDRLDRAIAEAVAQADQAIAAPLRAVSGIGPVTTSSPACASC